jgi:hypothetical protein
MRLRYGVFTLGIACSCINRRKSLPSDGSVLLSDVDTCIVLLEVLVFYDTRSYQFFKRSGDRGPSYMSYSSPFIISVNAYDYIDMIHLRLRVLFIPSGIQLWFESRNVHYAHAQSTISSGRAS